jgi:hypothetical protein
MSWLIGFRLAMYLECLDAAVSLQGTSADIKMKSFGGFLSLNGKLMLQAALWDNERSRV